MFLKKELVHMPFSKYNDYSFEYEDINDLKFGIFNLCDFLKKDIFLIQIFEKDSLNEQLNSECKKFFIYKNFNIYMFENIKIIENINFYELRFLNIYAIENQFICNDFNEMVRHCSFSLGLDNYFEYTKISINLKKYDDFIISQLLIKK